MGLKQLVTFMTLGWTTLAMGASCGGDGPQPFLNLTLTSKVKKLGSVGTIKDFVFWENTNTIVYRNEDEEVRLSDLNTGSDRYLTDSRYPISRVVDPDSQFLIDSRTPYSLDVDGSGTWKKFWSGWGYSPNPVHWSGGNLRLTRAEKIGLLPWKIKIWDYSPAVDNWSNLRCELVVGQNQWHYVRGAEAPYLYLYEVTHKNGDSYLNYYRMNTDDCSVVSIGTPSEPLPGKVKQVYRFPQSDALVAEVDHPTLNLRWQEGNRCRYHDIGAQKPLFMGTDHPVVGTFNSSEGLTLYNLETQRKVRAIEPQEITTLDEKDLWLTKKGARLLFSPETPGKGRRLLLELEVDPLVPTR